MYVNVLSMVLVVLGVGYSHGAIGCSRGMLAILFVVASRDHRLKNKRGYTPVRGSETARSMS